MAIAAQYPTPTTDVGPLMTFEDGRGSTRPSPEREWVHPNGFQVPAGSWMKYLDAAEAATGVGSVTHVRIDTPFPNFADNYENPHLLYSTDYGATWALWPAFPRYIDPWSGDGYNSDTCCTIKADGSLYAAWRWFKSSIATKDAPGRNVWEYQIISGTNLTDAVKTVTAAATIPTYEWLAPSIVQHGGLWHAFVVETWDDALAATGEVLRWTSDDEGVTWTHAGTAIAPVLTAEADTGIRERFWHGSVTGPFDGWFFALYSVNDSGTSGGNASFRVWRSQDLLTWERSDRYMMTYGEAGSIASMRHYQGSIIRQGASYAVLFSGYDNDLYRVGVLSDIDPHAPFDRQVSVIESKLEVLKAGGAWEEVSPYADGEITGLSVDPATWPAGATQIRGRTRNKSTGEESPYVSLSFDVPAVAPTNTAPAQPTCTATATGQTTATLTSSAFSDPDAGDTHAASQWQVTLSADTGFASPVVSTGDTADLTNRAVTGLTAGTAYRARVRHKDAGGLYSPWSAAATFSTSAASPTNRPPTGSIVQPDGTQVEMGTPLQLTFTKSDPDGDPVSVSCVGNNPSAATVGAAGLVTPVAPGQVIVTATFSDGSLSVQDSVTLNVVALAPPLAPVILGPPEGSTQTGPFSLSWGPG